MKNFYVRTTICALLLIYVLVFQCRTVFASVEKDQYLPYENVALVKVLEYECKSKGPVFLSLEIIDKIRGPWVNGQKVRVYFYDKSLLFPALRLNSRFLVFINYCNSRQMQPAFELGGMKFERVELPLFEREPVDIEKLKSSLQVSPYHKEIVLSAELRSAVNNQDGKTVRLSVCNVAWLHGNLTKFPNVASIDVPRDHVFGFTKLPVNTSRRLYVILEARNAWITPKSQFIKLEDGTAKIVSRSEIAVRKRQLQLSQQARRTEKEKLIAYLTRTWTPEMIALYCSPHAADLPEDQSYTGFGFDEVWSGSLYSSESESLGKVNWKCGLIHYRPNGVVVEVVKPNIRWTILVDLGQYPLTKEDVYKKRILSTFRRWVLESRERRESRLLSMVSFDSRVDLARTSGVITGATIDDSMGGRVFLNLGPELQIESVRFEERRSPVHPEAPRLEIDH